MAVRIRLMRGGRKKLPMYRIVVADSKAPRDGRYIEIIGRYNPLPTTMEVSVDESRLFKWLDDGAAMSDTVKNLMRHQGLTLKYELRKRNADEATVNKEMQKWEMARQEREKNTTNAKPQKAEAVKVVETKAEPADEPVADEKPVVETVAEMPEQAAAPVAEAPVVEPEVEAEVKVDADVVVASETPAEEPEQAAETESKAE